jgi:hypothetical protein
MNIEDIVKIIENEFTEGKIKQMGWIDLIKKLRKKGYKRIDIDDALDEAERRKIIDIKDGFCRWIDPSLRKEEKAKTKRRFQVLAEIFRERRINFIPQEDLEAILKEKGFDDEEILNIIAEAERDHVLRFSSRSYPPSTKLVPSCTWIPPRDRKKEAEADRNQREWFEKQLEKYEFEDERWG